MQKKFKQLSKAEVTIKKEDVGAYYFAYPKRARKVTVQELEVGDTGFVVPSIDAAVEKQNAEIEELMDQLYFA